MYVKNGITDFQVTEKLEKKFLNAYKSMSWRINKGIYWVGLDSYCTSEHNDHHCKNQSIMYRLESCIITGDFSQK